MLITKEIEIDMGHRVMNHKSKCRNLHGHRYKIEVGVNDKVVDTRGISDEGMVIDFGDLKQIMMEEIDAKLDHGTMVSVEDEMLSNFLLGTDWKYTVVDFIPTAENIAKYLFWKLKPILAQKQIKLFHVKLWETPTSTAIYTTNDI
jgi:6-pyruvoyltetrahydropterin/6-carboxytetrahydropterin synthase